MSYIRTSPWNAGVEDLGSVFGRLMLNMAQLNAQRDAHGQNMALQREQMQSQDAYRQSQLGLERDQLNAQVPMFSARAAESNAQAEQMKTMLAEALKMGLAERGAFAPQVDMSQGPTMEAARGLSLGDFIQSRGVLTGLNPSVLAQAVAPVEANQGAVVGDPKTGREIFRGLPPNPPTPVRPTILGPQQGAYDPSGNRIAFNDAVRPSATEVNPLIRNLPYTLSTVRDLSKFGGEYGEEPLYSSDPNLGAMYTNALTAAMQGLGLLNNPQGGRVPQAVVPSQPSAPSVGEGTVIENKQTGEKLVMKGGKWVPIR